MAAGVFVFAFPDVGVHPSLFSRMGPTIPAAGTFLSVVVQHTPPPRRM